MATLPPGSMPTSLRPGLLPALLLLAGALGACRTTPPVELNSELRVAPALDEIRPSDVAVLPVEDATVDGAFAEVARAFRSALIGALPLRGYAPLAAPLVDREIAARGGVAASSVDTAWVNGLRGAFGEDALLGVRMIVWDTTRILEDARVQFALEVLMLDAASGERLWSGRLDGSVKAGGEGPAPFGREARVQSAAEVLARELAEQLPVREPVPGARG